MSEREEEAEETSVLLEATGDTMEARQEHQVANRYKFLHSISLVLGSAMIILVLVWVFHYRGGLSWQSDPNTQFNWHPVLMTIGMIFIYAQSMLLYRSGRNIRKRPLKLLHAFLHCLAFILTVIALKAAFDSHNLKIPPIPNMYTLHSWVGLSTVILFTCQFVAGFISFLYPGFPNELRAGYMHIHTSFGTAGFVMALASAVMGLTEKALWVIGGKYQTFSPEGVLVNCIGLLTVLFGALVLYLVNEPSYKRVPLPEDRIMLASSQPENTE